MNITAFKLAQRFVNMKEVAGAMSNPAILAMLRLDADWPKDDSVPWCSAFVNYIAHLLAIPRSRLLNARSWLDVGRPVKEIEAVAGWDVVVLARGDSPTAGHVGFFSGFDVEYVWVLGGNQGDMVSVKPFKRINILGIRRLYDAA